MKKCILPLFALILVLIFAGIITGVMHNRAPVYTPPPNPEPQAILNEAQADAAAGRYREALAKHIWYRDNALKYQPGQRGVRNSFALMYWAELGKKYPPAMKKLQAIRTEAINQFQTKNGDAETVTASFITVISINNALKEKVKNVGLFKELIVDNPEAAKKVYSVLESDLIDAKEYALCGRYMDPDRSYARIQRLYDLDKDSGTPQLQDFDVKSFSNQTARLVAVLAINGRNDDALRISEEAAKELDTPEFAALLASARTGTVPPQWP